MNAFAMIILVAFVLEFALEVVIVWGRKAKFLISTLTSAFSSGDCVGVSDGVGAGAGDLVQAVNIRILTRERGSRMAISFLVLSIMFSFLLFV